MVDKALTPDARRRSRLCIGTPIEFQDGHEWIVSALPIGPAADPIIALQAKVASLEAKLQLLERIQTRQIETAKQEVDEKTLDEVLERFDSMQKKILDGEDEFRQMQLEIVHFALSLNYDVTLDEVAGITTLKQIRKVSEALQGAPQLKEIREIVGALKGESTGN